MADITCVKCGHTRAQMPAPPFPTELGGRVYDTICRSCWQEWLGHQTAVINHYGLDLRDAQARQFLTKQTETYLFGAPQG